jgi:hypothetical protein
MYVSWFVSYFLGPLFSHYAKKLVRFETTRRETVAPIYQIRYTLFKDHLKEFLLILSRKSVAHLCLII